MKSVNRKAMKSDGYKKTKLGRIPMDWEVNKLGNICLKFLNGGTPSTKNNSFWDGEIPWVTGADFGNQKIAEVRKHISVGAIKNSSTNLIPAGWLLIVTRTGVGKIAIAPFDVAISQDITGIEVDIKKARVDFLFRYLDFITKKLSTLNQGTSISGITRDVLLDIDVPVPPLPEQQKIACILSTWDKAIEKTEQLIAQKQQLKKGLMQQLLTGKSRFAKSISKKYKLTKVGRIPVEWELRSLSSISKIERGRFSPRPRNDPKFYGGHIPFVQTGDVANSVGMVTTHTQTLNDEGLKVSKLFKAGTILMTIASNIGHSAILKYDMACPDSLVGITPNAETDSVYLNYYLRFNQKRIEYDAPGGQKNINIEFLKPFSVVHPPLAEQLKIASVLRCCDKEIEILSRSLEDIKNQKKGLMQQLLTGKIRVRLN